MNKQVRLEIYDSLGNIITADESKIQSMSTHRMMLKDGPTIGSCYCGELDVVLRMPSSDIPKNAKLVPYIYDEGFIGYLDFGEEGVDPVPLYGERWKKKSEFFIFSRKVDKEAGTVSIVAYDAIYKAEEQYSKSGPIGTWPRTALDVMTNGSDGIAFRTGTAVCQETITFMQNATPTRMIDYPGIKIVDGQSTTYESDGETTMRDVAGYIAGLYGGNWIIDQNGEWRLIRLGEIPPETHFLITEDGDAIVMGGVRLLV